MGSLVGSRRERTSGRDVNAPADAVVPSRVILLSAEERIDEYLSLGYLAASLKRAGIPVLTAQWNRDGVQAQVEQELAEAPDGVLVGITWPYVFSEKSAVRLARWIHSKHPSSAVVVGGHPVSQDYARVLSQYPEIDIVVRGEGDYAIVDLFQALRSRSDLGMVPGLAWRNGEEVVSSDPPAQLDALEELPFADRSTLEDMLAHYSSTDHVVVRMLASRGCYAQCEFCSMVAFYALDGARMAWRQRDPEDLVEEMKFLLDRYGVPRFWFCDDEFIGPPKVGVPRIRALTDALLEADLGIEFGFDTRANGVAALEHEDLVALRSAGLRVVAMGLESGSQAALKRLNKGMKVERNYEAVRKLRAASIDHRYGFIMYDQGSSIADMEANIEFLEFADPTRICNTGPARLLNAEFPEMGTPLYKRLNLDGLPAGVLDQDNFPKLHEDLLGYEFADNQVERFRRILRRVAQATVEPSMIPRPKNQPAFTADTWWTGINYHPRNQAAMNAFLACHRYLLDHMDDESDDEALVNKVSDRYTDDFDGRITDGDHSRGLPTYG